MVDEIGMGRKVLDCGLEEKTGVRRSVYGNSGRVDTFGATEQDIDGVARWARPAVAESVTGADDRSS